MEKLALFNGYNFSHLVWTYLVRLYRLQYIDHWNTSVVRFQPLFNGRRIRQNSGNAMVQPTECLVRLHGDHGIAVDTFFTRLPGRVNPCHEQRLQSSPHILVLIPLFDWTLTNVFDSQSLGLSCVDEVWLLWLWLLVSFPLVKTLK